MTAPAPTELLKLADEYEAGLCKMEAAGYEEFAEVIPKHKMVIAALRQAASVERADACAKCGYPRSEHSYNGACYGLCGEFVDRAEVAGEAVAYRWRWKTGNSRYWNYQSRKPEQVDGVEIEPLFASPPRSEGVQSLEVQSEKVYLKTDPNALAARIGEIAGRCSLERDREAIIEAATYLRASAQASLDSDENQTAQEILDEIGIDRKIGADHRFSDEWWRVIEKCLKMASPVPSAHRGGGK